MKEIKIGTIYKSNDANDIVKVLRIELTEHGAKIHCHLISDPDNAWSAYDDELPHVEYGGSDQFKDEYIECNGYNTPLWRTLNES